MKVVTTRRGQVLSLPAWVRLLITCHIVIVGERWARGEEKRRGGGGLGTEVREPPTSSARHY